MKKKLLLTAFLVAGLFAPALGASRTAQVFNTTFTGDQASPLLLWYDGASTATVTATSTTLQFYSGDNVSTNTLGNGQDASPGVASGYYLIADSPIPSAPAVSGGTTNAPAALTAGTPSNGTGMTTGTYKWIYTHIRSDLGGTETVASSATQQVIAVSTTATVELTGITTGTSVTARKVYRTKVGGSAYFLLSTISNDTSTSTTDNAPDTSLTVAISIANAVTPGAHSYRYTYVNGNGESLPSAVSTTCTALSATSDTFTISSILTGPPGTTARNLYRSAVTSASLYLLATVTGNTTTTYVDSLPDTSLGAAIGATDTSGYSFNTAGELADAINKYSFKHFFHAYLDAALRTTVLDSKLASLSETAVDRYGTRIYYDQSTIPGIYGSIGPESTSSPTLLYAAQRCAAGYFPLGIGPLTAGTSLPHIPTAAAERAMLQPVTQAYLTGVDIVTTNSATPWYKVYSSTQSADVLLYTKNLVSATASSDAFTDDELQSAPGARLVFYVGPAATCSGAEATIFGQYGRPGRDE